MRRSASGAATRRRRVRVHRVRSRPPRRCRSSAGTRATRATGGRSSTPPRSRPTLCSRTSPLSRTRLRRSNVPPATGRSRSRRTRRTSPGSRRQPSRKSRSARPRPRGSARRRRPPRSSGVDLFRRYVGPEWPRVLLLGVLLLAGIGLQLANPQLLRFFIDSAISGDAVDRLAAVAVLFVCIALVHTVVSSAAQYVGESVGWKATNALRADLALHLLELDLGFHKGRTAGELIERIDGDVSSLANFFSRFVVSVIGNFALLLGVIVVVLAEDLLAGGALALYALVALVVLGRLRSIAVGRWRQVREVSAQLFGFIGERLAGTEDIRSSGAEAHVMNGLALQHRALFAARKHAVAGVAVIWAITTLTFSAGSAMAFGVGGYLWSVGAVTLGTVYLLFHYTEMLRRPI